MEQKVAIVGTGEADTPVKNKRRWVVANAESTTGRFSCVMPIGTESML